MSVALVGIAGPSGSGKTSLARALVKHLGRDATTLIPLDAYYRDLSHLSPSERARVNFDHPNSLETELLIQHVRELRAGRAVEIPVYDFTTHTRRQDTRRVEPARVILVEGILVLVEPELRKLFDVKLYVDSDADVRFIRRLRRDIEERGRTVESVCEQYLSTVRPMHLEFVEPSKRYADVIIPEGGFNEVAIEMVAARLRGMLGEHAR